MKKLLALLMLPLLLAGCASKANVSLPQDEVFDPSFAYVSAGYESNVKAVLWHAESGYKDAQDAILWEAGKNAQHQVYKVRPGKYVLKLANIGSTAIQPKNQVLAYFNVQAGKITYLGDISIKAPELLGKQIFILTSSDNSSVAKSSIKKNHPGLSEAADTLFIYRPTSALK